MSTQKSISFNLKGVTNGIINRVKKDGLPDEETFYPDTLSFLGESAEYKNFQDEVKTEVNGPYSFSILIEPNKEARLVSLKEENKALLRQILDNTGDPEAEKKAFAEELRIAVTEENAYSAEVLKRVRFMEYKTKFACETKYLAEVAGMSLASYYQAELKIAKGTQNFSTKTTRKYFTILAKYYEFLGSSKNKLKERVEELEEGLAIAIDKLKIAVNKNCMVQTSGTPDVLNYLKELLAK